MPKAVAVWNDSIGSLAAGGSEILLVDRELVPSVALTQATVDQLEQLPALW
jgi:hypothetical protein